MKLLEMSVVTSQGEISLGLTSIESGMCIPDPHSVRRKGEQPTVPYCYQDEPRIWISASWRNNSWSESRICRRR